MKRFVVGFLCAAAMGVMAATAWATPGTGVRGTVLGTGTSGKAIELAGSGPADVVVRHIVIEPGGSTGWHYHPGEVLAVVTKGTLTRTLHDCSELVDPAGQAFVESAGKDHIHIGRNRGPDPVELIVTYVLPAGTPLSIDAPDPGCEEPSEIQSRNTGNTGVS